MLSKVLVFTGRANPHLAAKICGYMKVRPGKAMVTEFADGECRVQIEGVSPDDHTLYTDLLEWRAINHELAELLHIFEAL